MTVPAWLVFNSFPSVLGRRLRRWTGAALFPIMSRLDSSSPYQRRAIAITGSALLHLGLVLLLLPSNTGLSASMGTVTGLGTVNGAGTAVTLVDLSELTPPKASEEAGQTATAEPSVATPEPTDISETQDEATPADQQVSRAEKPEAPVRQALQSDSNDLKDSTAEATAGAFGQNGQANLDLWNAIAPCWNRIADGATLPATLKISFDANGGLALPPEIERDPDAKITDQSLKSEAQALQALSECGAYPMAQGQQNVVVQFPTPGQMPASPTGKSGQMAAVVR
ncbi:hypothetical protein ASTA108788_16920 [Asticcacaulis taihuensis]